MWWYWLSWRSVTAEAGNIEISDTDFYWFFCIGLSFSLFFISPSFLGLFRSLPFSLAFSSECLSGITVGIVLLPFVREWNAIWHLSSLKHQCQWARSFPQTNSPTSNLFYCCSILPPPTHFIKNCFKFFWFSRNAIERFFSSKWSLSYDNDCLQSFIQSFKLIHLHHLLPTPNRNQVEKNRKKINEEYWQWLPCWWWNE